MYRYGVCEVGGVWGVSQYLFVMYIAVCCCVLLLLLCVYKK